MKIIQANKYFHLKGGAERYVLSLSDWLTKQGHVVLPFAMKHESNLPASDRYFVSPVQTQQVLFGMGALKTVGRMLYSFEARRKMDLLIDREKPQLCHIHNIYTQISPSILHTLKDHRLPTVMTVHDHHLISPQYNIWADGCGNDYRDLGIVRGTYLKFHKGSHAASFAQILTYKVHRWMQIYQKQIDLFICPSQYMQRQMIRGGFPREKLRVNAYGYDGSSMKPRYDHDGYVLFVGRLSEEKGAQTVIQIAKMLPEVRFKIVGRGPQMDYLHRLALGMRNVEFLGFREGDELNELYRGAIALLVPSRVHEVFPLTILEAMAAGKPVIASHVGGVPEVVEDHVTGILVQPTDLGGWIEAVLRLFYDADFQNQLSRNARHVLDTKFRVEDHYRRLMQIYEEAIRLNEKK